MHVSASALVDVLETGHVHAEAEVRPRFLEGFVALTFRFVKLVSVVACTAAIALVPSVANAQAPTAQEVRAELDALRKEFETLRDAYGARLAALEARLAGMAGADQQAAIPGQPAVGTEVQAPVGAAGGGGPTGPLPVYGNTSALSKIFNPDIAVIGNFLGAAGKNDVDPPPALSFDEAEATFQAVVDPYARADFFLGFSPQGVEIEEGFLTFTSLPGGLLAKVGKMKQQVGKVNTLHTHALPWADKPLMVQNLFGGDEGLADAGVSVSKLITNPWVFLEATGEVYQGSSSLFASQQRSDVSWVGRLRGYHDVTESTNLDIGASYATGTNELGSDFRTSLYGIDATFRYRPLRRAIYRRLQARTEVFWSKREQDFGDADAFGMYVSGEYQFSRRWFAGARYDWSERAIDAALVDKGTSFLLTYWPSEFSQIRTQYRRTRYAEGATANEVLFQFLFSIGAHGAHVF